MSIRVMSAVWDIALPDSQKIVLLALADCANDEGQCWPSMRTLAAKCSKGERTVQGVIAKLVEAGHLTRREVPGKGCNYTVHPRNDCAPAETAPPQGTTETPAETAGHPRSGCGQTVIEPSKKRKEARPRADRPDCVSEEVWTDFIGQRKKLFTPTALKQFVAEVEKAGWSLQDAMAYATMRGWEGFNAEWVEKRQAPKSDKPAQSPADWLAYCEGQAKKFREMRSPQLAREWDEKARQARERIGVVVPMQRTGSG